MYGVDLIKKYFTDHPDKEFNIEFRKYGGFFCGQRNSIYEFQKLSADEIKIFYKNKSEYRNQPIIENGQRVGHVRLATPHTIITSQGSFILQGVKKIKQKDPIKKWRWKDVKIRRSFWPWSKKLIVKINNDNLNLIVKCTSIIPDTYSSETIRLDEPTESKKKKAKPKTKTSKPKATTSKTEQKTEQPLEHVERKTELEPKEKPTTEAQQPKRKPKEPETLPPSQKPTPAEPTGELYTQYSAPSQYKQHNPWQYPVAKIPEKGCIVRSYRTGSTKRRGFKDATFQRSLAILFGNDFSISGNARLNTGTDTRPYEPDIALIDTVSNLNIRINIEIDEPYAGITRQATHCIGEDDLRDIYLVERGWIVIRFTEYQVHKQENECLAFIAELIQSINPSFKIPSAVQGIVSPASENQWDLLQAQKWESKKWLDNEGNEIRGWREEYLQHIFRRTPEVPETPDRELNDQEKKEEERVNHSALGEIETLDKIGFNKQNKHPRDKRIRFYPEPHIYEIDGVPAHSASTIVSRFFPEFDVPYWSRRKAIERIEQEGGELTESNIQRVATEIADGWRTNGEAASRAGTFLHQQIENFFLQEPYEQPEEFQLFLQFREQHNELEPFRTEWRIFDEEKLVAGTIDLIVRNGNGFDLYDWKRSKRIISSYDGSVIRSNSYQQGIGQLSDVDDTGFNRYAIQQNIYRHILEAKYGLTINNMYLVVIHPKYDTFHKVPVERQQDKIDYIFRTI